MITEKNSPKVICKVVLDKCFILNISIEEKRHIKIKKKAVIAILKSEDLHQ